MLLYITKMFECVYELYSIQYKDYSIYYITHMSSFIHESIFNIKSITEPTSIKQLEKYMLSNENLKKYLQLIFIII